MAGFKNDSLNIEFGNNLLENIIEHLIKCSSAMKADCISTGKYLQNHEDRITDRLVAQYLNAKASTIKFLPQAPESFNADKDSYDGRIDIKVVTNDWFDGNDDKRYYLIECKRVDGSLALNRKYINEGVSRFVGIAPKYSSYYKRNIMFGYIVQNIDIPQNVAAIDGLQASQLVGIICGSFSLLSNINSEYYIYGCQYGNSPDSIELRHLFYNFSEVIC